MILTIQQARELIEKPRNASYIKTAQELALRASLHCERYVNNNQGGEAFNVFFSWVERFVLSDEKKDNFKSFFRFPSETVNNVEEILDEFKNIFNAQDRNVKHTLNTEDLESDFSTFLSESSISSFIKNEVFKSYFCSPNDFIIYDLPSEQVTERPTPYPVLISVYDVVDFFNSSKDKTEYLIYKQNDKYIIIDDVKYIIIKINDKGELIESFESFHGMGKIPAQIIGKDNLIDTGKQRNNQLKTSRLHKILTALDELLFKKVSKLDTDLYALYPILSGYKQRCDYTHPHSGARCKDGYVTFTSDDFAVMGVEGIEGHREKCPKCSKSSLRAAGSFITTPAPDTKDDADLRDPVTRLSGDVVSLEWIYKDLSIKENDLFLTAVGDSGLEGSKQYNELKIAGSYESKKNILKDIARDFESIEKYSYEVLAKLRYFEGQYINSFVSYGNDFFTLAFNDAHELYRQANKEGLEWLKPILSSEILSSKFDNNKEMKEREILKQKLNPLYFKTPQQVQALKDSLPKELFLKGVLFDYFLEKFELDYGRIEKLMFDATIQQKIFFIDEKLNELISKYNQVEIEQGEQNDDFEDNPQAENQNELAQANLRGSVGGVQGILQVQASVQQGTTQRSSAITILENIYGFDNKTASEILGNIKS